MTATSPQRRGGVHATASRRALDEAERAGIGCLENAIEQAILAGRKSDRLLCGERLEGRRRHVLLDQHHGVIVEKGDRTAGGRRRYRALYLVRLRPLGRRR